MRHAALNLAGWLIGLVIVYGYLCAIAVCTD